MKKNVTKIKEYEDEQYFCDLCGEQFNKGICGNNMHVCKVCGRDVCDHCSVQDDYFAWCDETVVVCKYCNKVTKPFKVRLDKLYEDHRIENEQIWKEFKDVAEENFKKQNVKK